MTRLISRALTIVVSVVAILAIPVTASAAIPGTDCKKPPAPETPGRGSTSLVVQAPATLPTGPSWVNNRPSFEHYAYAGLRWNTYDLGCTGALTNSDAMVGTGMANWLYEAPKFMVAATGFAVDTAYHPTFLQYFDPLVVTITDALRRVVFDQWVSLFVVLAALMMLWRARKMQVTSALSSAVWIVAVFVIASAVFQWPLRAGHAADQVVTSSLGAVNGAINGANTDDPAAGAKQNITGAVLYEQWKTGEFGSSNSATANKYAQAIWESTTLTWAEAKTVEEDPDGAGKKLIEAKGKKYEDTADKIKEEDPDAYEYFTGKRDSRLGAAFVALIAAIVTVPFLMASSLLILAAFLLVRLGVVFFPVIATLAVFDKFRGMLKGLGMTMAAAVINCIVFGIGTAVAIYSTGVLLSPDTKLSRPLALILTALFMFIMWKLLAPARKLTVMLSPNRNLFGEAAGAVGEAATKTRRTALDLAGKFVTSYLGGAVAASKVMKDSKKDPDVTPEENASTTSPEYDTTTTITVDRVPNPQQSPIPLVAAPAAPALDPAPVEQAPYARPPAPDRTAIAAGPTGPQPPAPNGAAAAVPGAAPGPAPQPPTTPTAPQVPSPSPTPIPLGPAPVPGQEPGTPTEPPKRNQDKPIRLTGRRAPEGDEKIWSPGESQIPHGQQPPPAVDPVIPKYQPVVNEDGEEIYPVFDPSKKPGNEDDQWWSR